MRKSLDYQRQVWMIGEMGTGKTMLGAATHIHAKGQPCEHAVICQGISCGSGHGRSRPRSPTRLSIRSSTGARSSTWFRRRCRSKFNVWPEPEGPEWTIIGRDRIEARVGLAQRRPGQEREARSYTLRCPACGQTIKNRDSDPIGMEKLPKSRHILRCKNTVGMVRGVPGKPDEPPVWVERECEARSGSTRSKPYHWAPERVIANKLRWQYDYLIADEVHEYKGLTPPNRTGWGRSPRSLQERLSS